MRDARPADFPPAHLARIRPVHPLVWIRLAGAWWRGCLSSQVHHGDRWLCWLQHDPIDTERPWAHWGWYVYEPETIRGRRSERPPDRWRDTCTWAEARPYMWPPAGTRRRATRLPCLRCAADAEVVAADRIAGTIGFRPCGCRVRIAPPTGP